MRAYILIEATIGKARDVAAKMKQVPQVKQCFLVTGPYDVIAVVEGADANAVGTAVTSHVHAIPGVARTVTCLAVGL